MSITSNAALAGEHTPASLDTGALDRSLFSGIAWTAVYRWTAQVISWAATLYAARILTPGHYGLVAMAMIPIGLARMVEDFGLDTVIVQNRALDQQQLSRLGGFALLLSGLLAVLYIALATPIARYFREPAVAALICTLSLIFIADALQILPRALLQRDLRFRTLAWVNGLQFVASALILLSCALLGLGHWSLVFSSLGSAVVITAVLVALRPFTLAWPRELDKLARPLAAGWKMLVSRAAYYGYSNMDSTLIGRSLGKDALGAYGFAMTFATMPIVEVTSLFSKVVPGIFSTVQHSKPALSRYFLMLTEAISYLTFPMSIGLALTADDFVLLALGDQWQAAIAPLRILCLYMAMNSCQMLLSHVLIWTGHFRANMWLNIFALLVLPLCFYLGVQYGATGVAWGWAIGYPVSTAPAFFMVFRILNTSFSAFWNALRPALIACLIMGVAVVLVRQILPEPGSYAMRLGIQALVGVVVYAGVMLIVFWSRVLTMYRTIIGKAHG